MIFHFELRVSMKIYEFQSKINEKSWISMISQGLFGNLGVNLIPPQVICRPSAAGGVLAAALCLQADPGRARS